MKLTLTHPLRDCWLRLKLLLSVRCRRVVNPSERKSTPPKTHRTTAFFELP